MKFLHTMMIVMVLLGLTTENGVEAQDTKTSSKTATKTTTTKKTTTKKKTTSKTKAKCGPKPARYTLEKCNEFAPVHMYYLD